MNTHILKVLVAWCRRASRGVGVPSSALPTPARTRTAYARVSRSARGRAGHTCSGTCCGPQTASIWARSDGLKSTLSFATLSAVTSLALPWISGTGIRAPGFHTLGLSAQRGGGDRRCFRVCKGLSMPRKRARPRDSQAGLKYPLLSPLMIPRTAHAEGRWGRWAAG